MHIIASVVIFHPNFGGVPVAPDRPCWRQRAHGPQATVFGREIIFEEFQRSWTRYPIVTDGRTDRRTDDLLSHHRTLR